LIGKYRVLGNYTLQFNNCYISQQSKEVKMIPKAVRVFPLSKKSEPGAFGTILKVYDFFHRYLPKKRGRFYIPTERTVFEKHSLILFQYAKKRMNRK
jgi:hypothetical protein